MVVDGAASAPRPLLNSVLQGTVWGPLLWNLFFADSRVPIQNEGFQEFAFDDDLNCFKSYDIGIPDDE